MKRFRAREFLLLCLPVLLFGGVWIYQWWRAEQKRVVGPLRVVASQPEWTKPTPRQIASGIGTVWRWNLEVVGVPDFEVYEQNSKRAYPNVWVTYARRSSPQKRIRLRPASSEIPERNRWTQWIYNAGIPADAFNFRLEGDLEGQASFQTDEDVAISKNAQSSASRNDVRSVTLSAKPSPISVRFPKDFSSSATPKQDTRTNLVLRSARIIRNVALSQDSFVPSGYDTGFEVIFQLDSPESDVLVMHEGWPANDNEPEGLAIWGRRLVDAQGNDLENRWTPYVGTWVQTSPSEIKITGAYQLGGVLKRNPDAQIRLYCSWKDQWPLKIVVPILQPANSSASPVASQAKNAR